NFAGRDVVRIALLDGVVDEKRLQEIAGNVADAVLGDVIDEKLDFFEVDEAAFLIFGDGAEKLQDFGGGGGADAVTFAGGGVTESDFVTFAESGKGGDGFGVLTPFVQVSEMVEGVDESGVEGVVLLRRRAPEQEGVEVEGDVFVEKWNREIGSCLGDEDAVIVRKARSNYGHGVIVGHACLAGGMDAG